MTGLRDLVRTVLQLPDGSVRFADEPFPAGIDAYVTLQHHVDTPLSYPKRTWDSVTEKSTIRSSQLGRVCINAYGIGSMRLLNKLRSLLSAAPTVKSELRKLELGLVRMSDVRNISALASPGFEERAVIDLFCTYYQQTKVDTLRVDAVTVSVDSTTGIDVNNVVIHMEKS